LPEASAASLQSVGNLVFTGENKLFES